MMQTAGEIADAVELVEDIGAWCGVCGDPLELGQEVVIHSGQRCHWDDVHLEARFADTKMRRPVTALTTLT